MKLTYERKEVLRCAKIGKKAVMAVYGTDGIEAIYDLVADLLHLAREKGFEPDYIIHMAQMHFDAEVEEEFLASKEAS